MFGYALSLLIAKSLGDGTSLYASAAPITPLLALAIIQDALLFFTQGLLLYQVAGLIGPRVGRVLLAAGTLVSCVVCVANGATLHYFNREFIQAAGDLLSLNVPFADVPYYATQYASGLSAFLCIAAHLLVGFIFCRRPVKATHWRWSVVGLLALQSVGLAREPIIGLAINLLNHAEPAFAGEYTYTFQPLTASQHRAPERRSQLGIAPRTVVLFINESLARFFPASDGTPTGLMARIVADSPPKAGAWIEFKYAKTNGTDTEISVPSMLTGVDPVEGSAKLHAMPFVFDLAHAAGYRTAFFTSQDYSWAGFDEFYRPARIETYVTGNNLPVRLPRVNDTGIDDMEIADRVADYVHHLGTEERCFLVINSNALHVPLQTTSKIPIPRNLTRAEQKVAFILESYYGRIFAALEHTDRLADSLMIVTSDHGDRDVKRPRSVDRIGDHFDEVITVPFYVHLPLQIALKIRERVASNAERTVANVDIAPTLAEVFGYGPPSGLEYTGYSLFSIVPPDRISCCLTTNEWKQWSQSAFSLSQGTERFIFMANAGAFWFDVARDPQELHGVSHGARYDAFLQYAMTVPLLQDILLRLEVDRQDQHTTH
jgi:hypothetical protein